MRRPAVKSGAARRATDAFAAARIEHEGRDDRAETRRLDQRRVIAEPQVARKEKERALGLGRGVVFDYKDWTYAATSATSLSPSGEGQSFGIGGCGL